ncbi:hypothetical protein C0Q70_16590 [Pomacea canaliculata]|uniref:Uncharacterized protein n=1 Tax=Pomacea canaliculata TaxID=400727 RepID=A0A2T7NQ94_POMCA|nr:hypothetical protein C0Q70_16590 [Pomacea canaliculata]
MVLMGDTLEVFAGCQLCHQGALKDEVSRDRRETGAGVLLMAVTPKQEVEVVGLTQSQEANTNPESQVKVYVSLGEQYDYPGCTASISSPTVHLLIVPPTAAPGYNNTVTGAGDIPATTIIPHSSVIPGL